MVRKQGEVLSAKVSIEVFHSPNGGLHLQQVGRIVLLMLHQLPAGIGNDLVLSILLILGQDSTLTSGFLLIAVP